MHSNRCLVIPDIHQDIAWVERIFARETSFDHVVFLGDYFDGYLPPALGTSVADTCAYLDKKRTELGERAVFLLGNHDIQYLEAKLASEHSRAPGELHYHCGASFNPAVAKRVAKTLSPAFWENARLFAEVNGWLLSHAGVARAFWPVRADFAASLATLEEACHTALRTMPGKSSPLLQAGEARGGDQAVGGITWLDWGIEFGDALPCPQIVGHTASSKGARRNGRSWCIDGRQTTYGVLTPHALKITHC